MLRFTMTAMAGVLTAGLLVSGPAQAGATTGTWRHSPEEVYATQQYQHERAMRRHSYERRSRRDYERDRYYRPRQRGWGDEF
ncbi:hypothetical protein [Alsobacter sp. SYSU BS001988]